MPAETKARRAERLKVRVIHRLLIDDFNAPLSNDPSERIDEIMRWADVLEPYELAEIYGAFKQWKAAHPGLPPTLSDVVGYFHTAH